MYDDELAALAACLDSDPDRAREVCEGLSTYALEELASAARTLAETAADVRTQRLGGQDAALRLAGGA